MDLEVGFLVTLILGFGGIDLGVDTSAGIQPINIYMTSISIF